MKSADPPGRALMTVPSPSIPASMATAISAKCRRKMQPGTMGVGLSVPAAAGLDEGGVRSRVIDDARRSHYEPPGSLSELSQFLGRRALPIMWRTRVLEYGKPHQHRCGCPELITVLIAWAVHQSASIGSRRS